MSPRTSGPFDKHDDLDFPSVLPDRICPPPAAPEAARHPLTTAGSQQTDVRSYLYHGRHRRPRPVFRVLQAATALLMFTGVSAALAHTQSTSEQTVPSSAVELAAGHPGLNELRAEALPRGKTTMSTKSTASKTTSASTSTEKTTTTTTSTTTTKPTWLPVSQAAAQPTDQVGKWLNEALGILKANGYSESLMNASQIRAIIQNESAGNPNAINLWDSNAAKGTPSKGLMQCIDPTFNAWSLPGHRSIYNPVDNIIAGVRYAIGTYGSISNVPGVVSMASGGSYQGY